MSATDDRRFRDQFSLTIGIYVGAIVGIVFLAIYLADQPERLPRTAERAPQVADLLAPAARIAVAGQDNSALAITPSARPQPGSATVTMPASGAEVFDKVCVACHGQGVGGAPRAGDATAWRPRIAKGKATLYQHAIEGFKGETGQMPPKGGRTDISDDLIRAAVDQMVAAASR